MPHRHAYHSRNLSPLRWGRTIAATEEKEMSARHGKSKTPEHRCWLKMKERCTNPNAINFERYGGRGIAVCEEWRTDFLAFYRDMGPRPSPSHSLERIDNLRGYSKENCRWATIYEQANNTRRNILITRDGRTQTRAQWCRELGLNEVLVRQRMGRDKWDAERAMFAPLTPPNPPGRWKNRKQL